LNELPNNLEALFFSRREKEMSFMKDVLNHSIPIWDKCAATSFVREMQDGSLSFERFKSYIIQDSIYLKYYARVYGKAIYHATTLKEIQLYYSSLNFVTDPESSVRLNYLKQFGMTDDDIEVITPLPENQDYIDFLIEIAEQGNEYEILMAVLPCMLSYSYIFRKIAAMEDSAKSRYWDYIQDYADDTYAENCRIWYSFADKKCSKLSETEQKKLSGIFKKASMLELAFWNMTNGE